MALETIYSAQTPASTDGVAGTARMLGMRWDTSAAGKQVTGGRVWIPATGLASGMRWQLWEFPSTLLQDILLDGHSGTPDSWMPIVGVAVEPITQSQDYIVTFYIPSTAGGDYVYSSTGGPITNGSITASNIFRNGGTSSQEPDDETFTGGLFFVDIDLNDEAASGVLTLTVPALEFDSVGDLTAAGILNASLAPLEYDSVGELTTAGILAATVPALEYDSVGELSTAGVLNATVPALEYDSVGELTAAGVLNATVPALEYDSVGETTVSGILDLVVPAVEVDMTGLLPVAGVLNITIPALQADLTGNSAAGGATVGPCGWTIPTPLCCDIWDTFPAAVQSAAQDYAATILWAATGRQFGLCEVSVRPCGMRRCDDAGEFWGYDWSGGTWVPYIFNGQWFNCGCGAGCCCDPRCQVRLMGPVDSIVEVTIGGIAVDPDTYRVDDNHWLVRTGGECWPQCADMDSDDGDNVFVVTYMRGDPVPNALLRAASTLACEWGKACVGDGSCRLSQRVSSLVRQGITIDMVDPNDLLESGLTGLWEVDTVIRAFNPYRNQQRLRIYAPELNVPRTVTSI